MAKLSTLSTSFTRYLWAEQRSPQTVKTYTGAIRSLSNVVGDKELAAISRDDIRTFVLTRATQVKSTTLSIEFRALKVFFRWLYDEGETPSFLMDRMRGPRVQETPPDVFTDTELQALLRACTGSRSRFAGIRDTAIVLTLLDCGMRRSELIGVRTDDVDLDGKTIYLRKTKNGKPRTVPIGNRATLALDRYLRARSNHPQTHLPALLLGQAGPLTDNGLYLALRERGTRAGVKEVRPHRFRHSWAHRASMAGMQTQDLMAIAGWKNVQMTLRYGSSVAEERAIAAHRQFSPGDRLDK
jgi:site-specific recombinase XerD